MVFAVLEAFYPWLLLLHETTHLPRHEEQPLPWAPTTLMFHPCNQHQASMGGTLRVGVGAFSFTLSQQGCHCQSHINIEVTHTAAKL